jgi:hypothetical protein
MLCWWQRCFYYVWICMEKGEGIETVSLTSNRQLYASCFYSIFCTYAMSLLLALV